MVQWAPHGVCGSVEYGKVLPGVATIDNEKSECRAIRRTSFLVRFNGNFPSCHAALF